MRPSILQQALDYDKKLRLSGTLQATDELPTVSSNPAAAVNQVFIPKQPDDSDVGTFENLSNRFLIGMDETQRATYDKLNIDSEANQGVGAWIESVMGQDFLDERIKDNQADIDENMQRIKHFNELGGDVGIIGKSGRYFEEELPMILGSSFGLIGSSIAAAVVGNMLAPGVGTAAGLAVAGAGLASSRYMESLAEASGTYRETLSKLQALKKAGTGEFADMPEEEMKRRALTASDTNFKSNMKLMVTDVPQLLLAYAPIAKVAAKAIGMGSKTFASGSFAGKLAEKSAYTAARYPSMGLIKFAAIGGIEAGEEGFQFATNDSAIAEQTGGKALALDQLFKNEEFQKSLIGGFAVGGFMKGIGLTAEKLNDLYKSKVKNDLSPTDAFDENKMKSLQKDASEMQLLSLYNWWERGAVPSMWGTLTAAAEKGNFNDKKAPDQKAETKAHVDRINKFKDNYNEVLDKFQATVDAFPEIQNDVESTDAAGKVTKKPNPIRQQLFLLTSKMHNIEVDLKETQSTPIKNNDYIAFYTNFQKELEKLAQDTIAGKDLSKLAELLQNTEDEFAKNNFRLVEPIPVAPVKASETAKDVVDTKPAPKPAPVAESTVEAVDPNLPPQANPNDALFSAAENKNMEQSGFSVPKIEAPVVENAPEVVAEEVKDESLVPRQANPKDPLYDPAVASLLEKGEIAVPKAEAPASTEIVDTEKEKEAELKKEFGSNVEVVKSGQKAVISRNPDLVKLSSDPEVADKRAQAVIDKYNEIVAKYDSKITESKPEAKKEESPAKKKEAQASPESKPADKSRKAVQQELPLETEQKGQYKLEKKDDGTFDLVGPEGVVKNYKQRASAVTAADKANKKAIAEGKGVAKKEVPVEKKEDPKPEEQKNTFTEDFQAATAQQKHSVLGREISLKGGKIKATIKVKEGKANYFGMNIGSRNKVLAYLKKHGVLPEVLNKENGFIEANRELKVPELENEDGSYQKIPDGWEYRLQPNFTYTLFDGKRAIVTDVDPRTNTQFWAGTSNSYKAELSDGRTVNLVPEKYGQLTIDDDGTEVELSLVFPRVGEKNVQVIHGVPVYVVGEKMYSHEISVVKDGVTVSTVYGSESISVKQSEVEEQKNEVMDWLDRNINALSKHRKTHANDALLGIPLYITELALKAFRAVYKSLKGNEQFSPRVGEIIYNKMRYAQDINPDLKVDINDPMFIEAFANAYNKFRSSQPGVVMQTPEIVSWYEANSGSEAEYLQAWEKRMRTIQRPLIIEKDGKYSVMLNNKAVKYRINEKAKERVASDLTKAEAEKALSAWKRKQDNYIDAVVKSTKEKISKPFGSAGLFNNIDTEEAFLSEEFEGLDNEARVRRFQIENNMKALSNRVRIFFKIPGVGESNVREELALASRQMPAGKKTPADIKKFYIEHPELGSDIKNFLKNMNLPDNYYVSLFQYMQSWEKEEFLFLQEASLGGKGLIHLVQNTLLKQKVEASALAVRLKEYVAKAYINNQDKEDRRFEDWNSMLKANVAQYKLLKEVLSKTVSSVPGLLEVIKKYEAGDVTINELMKNYYAINRKIAETGTAKLSESELQAVNEKLAAYLQAIHLVSTELGQARAITQEMMDSEMKFFEAHTGLTKQELLASTVASHNSLKGGKYGHEYIITNDPSVDPVIESSMLHMIPLGKNPQKSATLFLSRVIQDYNATSKNSKGGLPATLDFLLTEKGRAFDTGRGKYYVSLIKKVATGTTSGTEMILAERFTSVNGKGADGAKLNHFFRRQSKKIASLVNTEKFKKNGFVQLHKDAPPVIKWIDGIKFDEDAKKLESFTSDEILVMFASFYLNRAKDTGVYLHPIEILGDRITQMAFVPTQSYSLANAKNLAGPEIVKAWEKSKKQVTEALKRNVVALRLGENTTVEQLAEELFYNYAVNKKDVDAVYQGSQALYKGGYDGKVKRASQSGSTGINPVMDLVGGVKKQTRIAVIKDKPGTYHLLGNKEAKTKDQVADGTIFIAERYSDETAVSTGGLFHFDGTIKAQINEFDPITDNRFLLKSNWVVLTEQHALDSGGKKGDLYKIWKALNRKDNPLDIVAFDSSAKVDSGAKDRHKNSKKVDSLKSELEAINEQKLVEIGSKRVLSFEENFDEINVELLESERIGDSDKVKIKVKNIKTGKTYHYVVDKYGFGEKATLDLKKKEVLFIDEKYKKEIEDELKSTEEKNDLTVDDLENLDESKVYPAESADIIYQSDLRFDPDPAKMEFEEGEFPVQPYRYMMQFPEFDELNNSFLTQQHEGFVQASRDLLNARSVPYLFVNFLMKNLKDTPEDNFIRNILNSSEGVRPDGQTTLDIDQLIDLASEDTNSFLSKKELVIGETILLKDSKDEYSKYGNAEGVLVKITDTEEAEDGKTKYTVEIINSKYIRGGAGFEQNKINNPIVRERIMGIVGNYVTGKAVHRKINRFAMQEVTSYGIEGDATLLNARVEVINGKRVLSPGQAYIPKRLEKQCIERDGKKYLFIIRVPTTEMHSISLVEVKGFLPDQMHNSIITDLATQSKAGSDNDGDQRFSMTEYKGKKLTDRQLNANKVVDVMLKIFLNPDNQKALDTPIDIDKIKTIVSNINPQNKEALNELDVTSALFMWNNNADAKKGIGIAARTLGIFQYLKKWGATIRPVVTVGGIKLNSFKSETVAEGQVISEELANLANVIVDNAKETIMLPLGLTQSTTNLYFALRMLGLPAEQITYLLTRTDVGKYFVSGLQNSKNILNDDTDYGVTLGAKKEFEVTEELTDFEIKKLSKATDQEHFHLINFAMKVSNEMYRYSEMMKINEDGILNESDYVSALKVIKQTKKISSLDSTKNRDVITFPKDEYPIVSRLMVPFRMAFDAAKSTYANSIFDTVPGSTVLNILAGKFGRVDYKKVLRAMKRVALSSAFGITKKNMMSKKQAQAFYDEYIGNGVLSEYIKFNGKIELTPGVSMAEAPQGIVDEITSMIEGLAPEVQNKLVMYHIAHYGWSFNTGFARAFPPSIQNMVGQKMGEIQNIWKRVDNKTALSVVAKIAEIIPFEIAQTLDKEKLEKKLAVPVDISKDPLVITNGKSIYVAQPQGLGKVYRYESVSQKEKGDFTVLGVTNRREERPAFDKLPFHNPSVKTMTFAGIGSREIPASMEAQVKKAIAMIKKAGDYALRSGGAVGADTMFEKNWGKDRKEIFLTEDAEKKPIYTPKTNPEEYKVAKEIHPKFSALESDDAKAKMARNTNQVFGAKLDTPADFVLCWTQDGATTAEQTYIVSGGTGQAIRMASMKGIPVINMLNPSWEIELQTLLDGNLVAPVLVDVKTQSQLDADKVLGKVKIDGRKFGKQKSKYMPLDSDGFYIGKGIYLDDNGNLYEIAKATISIFNGQAPSTGTIQNMGYSSLEDLIKDYPRIKEAIDNQTDLAIYKITKRGSINIAPQEQAEQRISPSPALDGVKVYRSLINEIEVVPGQENNVYVKTDTGWVLRKASDIVSRVPFGKHNIIIVAGKEGYGAIEPVTGRIVATNKKFEALHDDVGELFFNTENGLIDLGEMLYNARQDSSLDIISPQYQWKDGGVKYQSETLNEAKAHEDVAFQDYVRDQLHKIFPDVAYFTDAAQFQGFLDKHFPGEILDISKLGAAIESAGVYINPNTAVQSTRTHEYGHIYFDMLPEGRIKNAIRKMFIDDKGAFDEEAFVILLGKQAVSDLHENYKGKSTLKQIIDLLKEFWSLIKLRMNRASKTDIVKLTSRKMLRGVKRSGQASKKTSQGLKYMTGNMQVDTTSQMLMDMNKSYEEGPFQGEFTVDDLSVLDNLDAVWGTNININRDLARTTKKTINGKSYPVYKVPYSLNKACYKIGSNKALFGATRIMQNYDAVKFFVDPNIGGDENIVGTTAWKNKHIGTPLHTFLEEITIHGDFEQAYDKAVEKGLTNVDKDMLHKNIFDPMMAEIQQIEKDGGKVLGEMAIGNESLNTYGKVDLTIVLGDGTVRISDYKSSESSVYDSSGNFSAEYTKSVNGNASKEVKHATQLDIYAYTMGTDDAGRESIPVSETEIKPIKFTLNGDTITDIAFEKPILRKVTVKNVSNGAEVINGFNQSLNDLASVDMAQVTAMTEYEFAKEMGVELDKVKGEASTLRATIIAASKNKSMTKDEKKVLRDKLKSLDWVLKTVKGKYDKYKKDLDVARKLLGSDDLTKKSYAELLDLYRSLIALDSIAKNTELGRVLNGLRAAIASKQITDFNTANPEDAVKEGEDLTLLDVLNLAPSQMKATQPILRLMTKMQLEASQRAQDKMRVHLKELEKLDTTLRQEWNKKHTDFWTKAKRFVSKTGGYRYYENLWETKLIKETGKRELTGNYKLLDDPSLSSIEQKYLEFIYNYKSDPNSPVGKRIIDAKSTIRHANGGIQIAPSTFEIYHRLGFFKALSHWLKGAYAIDSINLYVTNPATGAQELLAYRDLMEAVNKAVEAKTISKIKAAALVVQYTSKAKRLLASGKHDAIPGTTALDIGGFTYRRASMIENGEVKEKEIKGYQKRTLDENLELRSRFFYGRGKKSGFSLDVYSAMQQFIMEMEYETAMTEKVTDVNGKDLSVMDMALMAQVTYQTNKDVPNAAKWLEHWVDQKVYGKEAKTMIFDGERKVIQGVMGLTHLSVMTFAPWLGASNLVIGLINNVTFGGFTQYFKNSFNRWGRDFKKCLAVLHEHKIVNYRPEVPDNSFVGAFAKASSAFISIGEKIIQNSAFISRIPDDVWNNMQANADGGIDYIDPAGPQLTGSEINKLKIQNSNIQGRYGEDDKRNYHNVALWQLAMQFKTWLPDTLNLFFGGRIRDVYDQKQVGMTSAMRLWLQWAFDAPTKGMAEANANYQQFNKLSEFKTTQKNALKFILMASGLWLLASSDDEDEMVKKARRASSGGFNSVFGKSEDEASKDILRQFTGLINPRTLVATASLPALNTVGKFADLFESILYAEKYEQNSTFGLKGEYKAPANFLKAMPYKNLWIGMSGMRRTTSDEQNDSQFESDNFE